MESYSKLQTSRWDKIKNKFFKQMVDCCDEYDYIFLTTRRCFCLYNCIIENEDTISDSDKDKLNKKVFSSQAIDILGRNNMLNGKSILLCDDIMIHGQSVYRIFKIVNSYGAKVIDTLTMIRNIERPDYYRYKIGEGHKNTYISKQTDSEWRQCSNLIVKYIYEMSGLYLSYIYGFKLENNYIETVFADLLSRNIISKLDFQIVHKTNFYSDDCQPEYYIINHANSLFNNSYEFNCLKYVALRRYKIYGTDQSWIVPYVEFKDLKCNSVNDIFSKICKNCNNFSRITETTDMYKALTAIFSYLIFKELFALDDHEVEFSKYIDKSYFPDFLLCVKEIDDTFWLKNINDLVAYDFNSGYNDHCEVKSLMYSKLKSFDEVKLDKNNILNELYKYFIIVNDMENTKFKTLAQKTINSQSKHDYIENSIDFLPLRASKFYSYIVPNLENVALKILLYFMDTGIVSHVVAKFIEGDGEFVGTFIKNGEQSYRLFADFAMDNHRAVYFLFDYIDKFVEDKDKFLGEFLDKLKSNTNATLDKAVFEFFIQNRLDNYKNYYFGIGNLIAEANNKEKEIYENVCDVIRSML